MQNRMEIGDKVIRVGDNLRANKAAQSVGICHCGNIVKVIVIDDDNLKIGVYSEKENVGWGNLDGSQLHQRAGYDEWDAFLRVYTNLGCEQRNCLVSLEDLEEPTLY